MAKSLEDPGKPKFVKEIIKDSTATAAIFVSTKLRKSKIKDEKNKKYRISFSGTILTDIFHPTPKQLHLSVLFVVSSAVEKTI